MCDEYTGLCIGTCLADGRPCLESDDCCSGSCDPYTSTCQTPACPTCTTYVSGAGCVPVTAGTACGTGGACDNGQCFLAYPYCTGCGQGYYGVDAGGNGANLCLSDDPSTFCTTATCATTADCPSGQWCNIFGGCGNHCVTGCAA